MSWWIYLIVLYITVVLIFHIYVRCMSCRNNTDAKHLPVIIEPWYCPFLGPVFSMLNFEVSLVRWRAKYGDNFTLRILGKHLTVINKSIDLKRYYNASDDALSIAAAAQKILGSVYPESQYMVEYSAIPYLQKILTSSHLRYMSLNIQVALVDYFNHTNGQFWKTNGSIAVVDLFDFMYRLVLRMNSANFASSRIYKNHVDELIELYCVLDSEKSVMNPFKDGIKKRLGFTSSREVAWQRWIQLFMPDIERSLKMIELNIQPSDIDMAYQVVKYAKDELEKRGELFTPRLVAFLVYSSFLPAQFNTYATAAFVLLEWIRHEHDEIGQHIQDEIERASRLNELSIDDLNSMEYIQACIYEVIRLHTDAQLTLRLARQDVLLSDGACIPAGHFAATCMSGSQELYVDSSKFDPERHLAPREENKIDPYRILPFGRGKHPCTGERYVKMQIKLLLIHLSQMCKLEIMKESIDFESTVNRKQLAGLSRPSKPVLVKISKRDS
jgi:cytochrome P450